MFRTRLLTLPIDYLTLSLSAAQSIPNIAITKVTNLAVVQQDGLVWDATNDQIVIAGDGLYLFNFVGEFAVGAVGQRRLYIFLRGVGIAGSVEPANNTAAATHLSNVSMVRALNNTDFLDFRVFQSQGAALNLVNATVGIVKLRDV